MTRPSIVRADTIDLQDHDSPSAKDHHHARHSATGAHQASHLREVAYEQAEGLSRSPRLSYDDTADIFQQNQQQQLQYDDDLVGGVHARMAQQNQQQSQQQQQQQQRDQEDALAVAQNGGVSSSDEGDMDGDDLDDDMMDRISSSPSIEDEDIDFEFVYALHTFVATVEGQANATKGDTMVLLDDSNSYWWLVRVVKDSSIGYLPAEHIETPTERLARLNKHRNVDLSATMLGDQNPKQKNGFKAIRKRWKSVTFSEPTYVDYTERDYSSDEEDIEELFGQSAAVAGLDIQKQDKQDGLQAGGEDGVADESAKVEPLKTTRSRDSDDPDREGADDDDDMRHSEEIMDGRGDGQSRSRNGTVRNTDSFFKDDSVETKKISLTPNLLKDDNNNPRPSTESTGSKDAKSRPSLDKLDKELVADKDSKKDKQPKEKQRKEKEKKPSAIRSFFSRKDKKRTDDDDAESFGKRSMDIMSEPRDSEDPTADEMGSPEKLPGRSPSKLQKQQPRTEPSPTQKNANKKPPQVPQTDISTHFTESRVNDVSNVPPASMRVVDPETQETKEIPSNQQRQSPEKSSLGQSALPRSGSAASNNNPQKTVKASTRMELDDDSDSSEAEEALLETAAPQYAPPEPPVNKEKPLRPQLPGAFPDSYDTVTTMASERTVTQYQLDADRQADAGNVSPLSATEQTNPPGLTNDWPSPEGSPSPDLGQNDEPASAASAAAASSKEQQQQEASWDDSKLRAFFDDGEHVRDLLAVVYDTSEVEPAGHEHPLVGGLFREQNAKLAEITTQLDNMLGDWLARKQRSRGTL